jgi:hypothetical protein
VRFDFSLSRATSVWAPTAIICSLIYSSDLIASWCIYLKLFSDVFISEISLAQRVGLLLLWFCGAIPFRSQSTFLTFLKQFQLHWILLITPCSGPLFSCAVEPSYLNSGTPFTSVPFIFIVPSFLGCSVQEYSVLFYLLLFLSFLEHDATFPTLVLLPVWSCRSVQHCLQKSFSHGALLLKSLVGHSSIIRKRKGLIANSWCNSL